MNKLIIGLVGSTVLVVGCSQTYASPLLTFAQEASSLNDVATIDVEMTMMDSFQSRGAFGRMVSGFQLNDQDGLDQEIVLATKNNFVIIRDLLGESQSVRFMIALEADVMRAYASSYVMTDQSLSDSDTALFNAYVETYVRSREDARRIFRDIQVIRQDIADIVRSMNRPRVWSASLLEELYTLSEVLVSAVTPLTMTYDTMLEAVFNAQALLSTYFNEANSPISVPQREQINSIYVAYEQLKGHRDDLRISHERVRELIQLIRQTLTSIRDEAIELSETDQRELRLLRLAIQDTFASGRTLRTTLREHTQSLKGLLNLDNLDAIETTFTKIHETLGTLREQTEVFETRLSQLQIALSAYLA
jgi:hypothetical protein